MDWFHDWYPMTPPEIDMSRMKAYLNFREEEEVAGKKEFESSSYTNLAGDRVECVILLERPNGEIVVKNERGCLVCLTKDKLHEKRNFI